MIGCNQLSLPGWEMVCANPHCRALFHYDRTQPGKRYCSERCRTIHNNALIAARQRQQKPPEPRWHLTDPRSEDVDWDAYSAFAGGTEEGARAFLDQFEAVQAMKRTDRRKKYETEL